MPKASVRLGVLLSGRGSNFLAIARNIREARLVNIEIAVVISNVADAPGLTAARDLGLPTALFVCLKAAFQQYGGLCLPLYALGWVLLTGRHRRLARTESLFQILTSLP